MKRLLTYLIAIICIPALQSMALTQKEQQAVIASINKSSMAIQSMSSNFTQTKYLSLLSDKLVSEGKISYTRPDKLRWEYTSPYQYLFLFNGTKVYVGSKSKKEVIDTNTNKIFKEVARIMMSTVTGTALSNSSNFDISVSDANTAWKVTLVPKKKEMRSMFAKVILSFNKSNLQVSEIDIIEKNNDKTNIKFGKMIINQKIDASLFTIPK